MLKILGIDSETAKIPNHFPWKSGYYLSTVSLSFHNGSAQSWMFHHDTLNSCDYKKNFKEIQNHIDEHDMVAIHNAKFDLNVFRNNLKFKRVWCSQVAEYLLNHQSNKGLKLNDLAFKYGLSPKIDKVKIMWDAGFDTSEIPISLLTEYCEDDATKHRLIAEKQMVLIQAAGLDKCFKLQMSWLNVLSEMEINGVCWDKKQAELILSKYKKYNTVLDNSIRKLTKPFLKEHNDINLSSGDDLSVLLYGGVLVKKEKVPVIKTKNIKVKMPYIFTYKNGIKKIKTKWNDHPDTKVIRMVFGNKYYKIDGLAIEPDSRSKLDKHTEERPLYKTSKEILPNLQLKTRIQKTIVKLLIKKSSVDKVISTFYNETKNTGLMSKIASDGKLHTNYNQTVTATGRLSSSDPNCFSGDTEVLTKHGWIRFDKLKQTEHLAQYNVQNQEISFSLPICWTKDFYTGFMYHIFTKQHLDFLVTPTHGFYCRNRKTKNVNYYTSKNYPKDAEQIQSGFYNGYLNESKWKTGLRVAYQADGHTRKQDGIVEIGFSKEHKIRKLNMYLRQSKIPFRHRLNGTKVIFSISRKYVPIWFEKDYNMSYIIALKQTCLQNLAKELLFWDGHKYTETSGVHSSSIKHVSDMAQIVFNLTGHRTKQRIYLSCTGRPNYQLDVVKKDSSLTTNTLKIKHKWHNYVYCAKMPTGTLIVRRHGKIAITGNSQNLPRGNTSPIKTCIIPQYDGIMNADISQIELRVPAQLSQDPIMIKEFMDREDLHSNGCTKTMKLPLNKQNRFHAKRFNFRMIYGGTAFGYFKDATMPDFKLVKWKKIIERYFKRYSGIYKWQQNNINRVINGNGTLAIPTGRRFKFKLTKHGKYNEREIKNYPVQGLAGGDLLPLAGVIIHETMKSRDMRSKVILTVHDSIVFDYINSEKKELANLCLHVFNNLPKYIKQYWGINWIVPITGEIETGPNYGNLKHYK